MGSSTHSNAEKQSDNAEPHVGAGYLDNESDIYKAPENRKTIGITSAVFL
jgi:hypothetical protein